MIDPYSATTIIVAFLLIAGILIPVCGVVPKIKEIISYRYLVIVVFLAMSLAVIVDFSELDTSIKSAVIIGTAVLSGLYVVLRSLEKAFFNGWIGKGKIEASFEKGDIKAKVKYDAPKEDKKDTHDASDDLKSLAKYENQ